MNIASQVAIRRRLTPDRVAILFEGDSYSYAELDRRAAGAALELVRMGVGRGDRVALCLPNTPEFVVWYLGAMRIGAVAVTINPGLTEEEVRFLLQDSGARVALREPRMPEPAEGPIDDLPGDAPAVIVYTSGTTGTPKGATLSHGNVLFVAESKRHYLGIRGEDRMLLFLPLFHCFGQNAVLNAAFAGGAAVVLQRSFDAAGVVAAIAEQAVTMICGVPTHFIVLYDRATPDEMRPVRYFMSAAAPLPLEVERRWRQRFGMPLHQGYGLTESSPFASYNHETAYREGSIGTAIDGVEMAVADVETGRMLDAGETGEILVRGPNVMLGYWNRPVETRKAITDGWLRTGDVGRMDSDGYFYVEDRLKDMVIVGGFNVYPKEVEDALYRHPAVAEAGVYGVPDPVMGERVRAAVVLREGACASAEALLSCCRASLAEYKLPADFEFVAELPKGRTGKVLKRVLRERYRPLAKSEAAGVRSAAELERRIVGWIASQVYTGASVDAGAAFADCGFTSLLAVELAGELSRWLGRAVNPTITWSYPTAASLARHLMPEAAPRIEKVLKAPVPEIAHLSEHEAETILLAELQRMAKAQAAGQA
jgi:long-chain acyl-CoA synthetase